MLEDRLELLTDERSAMHMLNITLNGVVHLFVVHNIVEPEMTNTIECVELEVNDQEAKDGCQEEGDGDAELAKEIDKDCQKEGDDDAELAKEVEEGDAEL